MEPTIKKIDPFVIAIGWNLNLMKNKKKVRSTVYALISFSSSVWVFKFSFHSDTIRSRCWSNHNRSKSKQFDYFPMPSLFVSLSFYLSLSPTLWSASMTIAISCMYPSIVDGLAFIDAYVFIFWTNEYI